jgi:hypothetical protein
MKRKRAIVYLKTALAAPDHLKDEWIREALRLLKTSR